MKHKIWIYQIPVILIATVAMQTVQWGEQGELDDQSMGYKFYNSLRAASGSLTNSKFKARGAQPVKNKIVIVEVDDNSIESLGTWPWPRSHFAEVIRHLFDFGAKVVGLDIVFDQASPSIPPQLAEHLLNDPKYADAVRQLDSDARFEATVASYRDRLVLGFADSYQCQPMIDTLCRKNLFEELNADEPNQDQHNRKEYSEISKFTLPFNADGLIANQTPLQTIVLPIFNYKNFTNAARYAGYFNASIDPDAIIRRSDLIHLFNGQPLPSLPLAMASLGLQDEVEVNFKNSTVDNIRFKKSNRIIPTTPLGVMPINFRGGGGVFKTVSVIDIFEFVGQENSEKLLVKVADGHRKIAHVEESPFEVFKDAYVFIGNTAVGVYDIRHFPFQENVPGVEGHAHILDNLLSGDSLIPATAGLSYLWIILIMLAIGTLFAYYSEKLESKQALLLFIAIFFGFGFVDFYLLFGQHNRDWNTAFFYYEILFIFVTTMAGKYILEEKDRKFIKGAFGKFVSPAVVDKISKNPESLALGGEKRNITILFSDIRGFTTLSEKMDPKMLSSFLNEYLGDMTEIIKDTMGTLDKYIGDAVMAFWGAPIEFPEHAQRALEAAVRMQQAVDKKKKILLDKYGVEIAVGIGLNTGVVSVGNMGSKDNMAYTALGDDVNLASRLEGLTKEYGAKILCTQYTLDQIRSVNGTLPPHRLIDTVIVKGKRDAVELYQILDQAIQPEGQKHFETGRKLYLQQKFDAALTAFKTANEILKSNDENDGPSQTLIERCAYFKEHPPEADWDGTWRMKTK